MSRSGLIVLGQHVAELLDIFLNGPSAAVLDNKFSRYGYGLLGQISRETVKGVFAIIVRQVATLERMRIAEPTQFDRFIQDVPGVIEHGLPSQLRQAIGVQRMLEHVYKQAQS
jgi:hypothetical protein